MSQIRRYHDEPARIDVALLGEIEQALVIDCEPSPSIVAPLIARAEAQRDAGDDPERDINLVDEARGQMNGWLTPYEIHAVASGQDSGYAGIRRRYYRLTRQGHAKAIGLLGLETTVKWNIA